MTLVSQVHCKDVSAASSEMLGYSIGEGLKKPNKDLNPVMLTPVSETHEETVDTAGTSE